MLAGLRRACLLAAFALPDLLPPGHRSVEHLLVVTADGTPAGMRLVAAPVRGLHGVHAVVAGEPFAFSQKYGTRLFLLPADAGVPEFEPAWLERHAHSESFPQIASVPLGSPLHRVVTTWRIQALDGRRIALERVAEQRFDAAGLPLLAGSDWLPLAIVGALGAAWLVRLARQRPAARAPLPAS
jgi:hypothetical protein